MSYHTFCGLSIMWYKNTKGVRQRNGQKEVLVWREALQPDVFMEMKKNMTGMGQEQ